MIAVGGRVYTCGDEKGELACQSGNAAENRQDCWQKGKCVFERNETVSRSSDSYNMSPVIKKRGLAAFFVTSGGFYAFLGIMP